MGVKLVLLLVLDLAGAAGIAAWDAFVDVVVAVHHIHHPTLSPPKCSLYFFY